MSPVPTSLLATKNNCSISTPFCQRFFLTWASGKKGSAELEAAAVAGLVGSMDPATALAFANERFRALPFKALRPFDLERCVACYYSLRVLVGTNRLVLHCHEHMHRPPLLHSPHPTPTTHLNPLAKKIRRTVKRARQTIYR